MNITINGKITNALPPRRGTSKAGNEWVSQDFVIESDNEEKICFNLFGEDKIKESGLRVGAVASVTCKVESKEWNGKWFTSVSCVNCIVQGAAQPQPSQHRPHTTTQPVDFGNSNSNSVSADNLPF
jgi:hypothetical protein